MTNSNSHDAILNFPSQPSTPFTPVGNGPGAPVAPAHAGRERFMVLFLCDTSGSTGIGQNPDIDRIEEMLHTLVGQLANPLPGSPFAQRVSEVDVAIMSYADRPQLLVPWQTASTIKVPRLVSGGGTATGLALLAATDYVERRKRFFREYPGQPIPHAIPHIFHLTDGSPTGMKMGDALWTDVQMLLQQMAGTPEKPYQCISHFIAPNGLVAGHTGMVDQTGRQISGKEAMALWTGGDSVFELNAAANQFDALAKVIVQTLSGHTQHAGSIHDLLKRYGGKTIRNPGSVANTQPKPQSKPRSTPWGDQA